MSQTVNSQSVSHGMEQQLDTAIDGCNNGFPPGVPTINIRGIVYGPADLKTKLETFDNPFKNARAAHAALHQFTSEKPALVAEAREFLNDLKMALGGAAGANNQFLASWGFPVKKARKPLTSEEKLLRAAKAKLTRQKRGTLGKRQRAAIKQTATPSVQVNSDGTSVVLAPPAAPSGTVES
jgi:hypothetical protein